MPAVLRGANAAVLGLLLAVLCSPVWTSAINGPRDFTVGITAFLALQLYKRLPSLVVIAGALVTEALALVPL